MDFPSELRYTKDHEWIRVEADGRTATIGITDFAQSELGDIIFVELEPEDSAIDQEAVFGTVEAVKTVSELFMPVSGTIAGHNADLVANPERINEDPYGKGWLAKIVMSDPAQVDDLLSAEAYADLVGA